MRFLETLASYTPSLIVNHLIYGRNDVIPNRQTYETVAVFCDVSGFTKLSEAMAANGKGAEGLAKHLNSYFGQMVRLIASDGGDVFKFAGDAMIVLWPPSEEEMEVRVRRAIQCAIAIQDELHQADLEEGVRLSVKIGIGVGEVSVLHIGGVYGRMEYLAVGDLLLQAFAAEHHAESGGDIWISPETWKYITDNKQNFQNNFEYEEKKPDGYVRLDRTKRYDRVRKQAKVAMIDNDMESPILETQLRGYVPGAVLPNLNPDSPEDEKWGNETRTACTMFVNLGIGERQLLAAAKYDEAMWEVHEVLVAVQNAVYRFEGSINKFLMDDKGSTLIACFGLPPNSHEDDPIRAVLAGLYICELLENLNLTASVGITTGNVFSGVVGSKTRREYTVLGDPVNLSARLMQRACTENGGVICELGTKLACQGYLQFENKGVITVKGKSVPIHVFRPYPPNITRLSLPRNANLYHFLLQKQLTIYSAHKALNLHQSFFNRTASERRRESQNEIEGRRALLTQIPEDNTNKVNISNEEKKIRAARRTTTALGRRRRSRASVTENGLTPLPGRILNPSSRPSKFINSSALSHISEVLICVPENLLFDNVHENSTILPITYEQSKNFLGLLEQSIELAKEHGLLNDEEKELTINDFSLNISGSRAFLPKDKNIDVSNLPAFQQEAMRGSRDDYISGPIELTLTKEQEKLNCQHRLSLCRLKLLESKISLLDHNEGSIILIEGEPGVGKTNILAEFVAKTLPHTMPIFCTSGSSYNQANTFGVWRMIFQQYLETKRIYQSKHGAMLTRTQVLLQLLKDVNDELKTYSYFLNELLLTKILPPLSNENDNNNNNDNNIDDDFNLDSDDENDIGLNNDNKLYERRKSKRDLGNMNEESDEELEWDHGKSDQEIYDIQLNLLFHLLKKMSHEKHYLICIDDAQYLDHGSWTLALKAANGGNDLISNNDICLPIMLVLSFRPIINYYPIFLKPPPDYQEIIGLEHTIFLKIDGLPQEDIDELVVSKLGVGVVSFSDQLFKLINDRCSGNPLMVKELVTGLKNMVPPVLVYEEIIDDVNLKKSKNDTKGSNLIPQLNVSLIPTFEFDQAPLPPRLFHLMVARLDRFNSCQQMILKTGTLIGNEFKWSDLYGSYPIDGHKHRLRKELEELLESGVLMQLRSSTPITAKPINDRDADIFRFTQGFLRAALECRMLRGQKELINEKISKHLKRVEDEITAKFVAKLKPNMSLTAILKTGALEIQKKVKKNFFGNRLKRRIQGGDWKIRYVQLTSECLSMYKTENFDKTPTQVIYLEGASVSLDPPEIHGKDAAFHIQSFRWQKEGKMNEVVRQFIFNADSPDSAAQWVSAIKAAIASHNTEKKKNKNKKNHDTIDVNEIKNDDDDIVVDSDSLLILTIHKARNLINASVYGLCNPYCWIELQDQRKKTTHMPSVSMFPTWGESFVFQVNLRQWFKSSLKLQFWNRDLFLTDDFLGQIHIPLTSIKPEVWDLEKSKFVEDGEWYKLLPRKVNETVIGDINLGVRLLLSPKTTTRAENEGGLEAFRTNLEKRLQVESVSAIKLQMKKLRKRARENIENAALNDIPPPPPLPDDNNNNEVKNNKEKNIDTKNINGYNNIDPGRVLRSPELNDRSDEDLRKTMMLLSQRLVSSIHKLNNNDEMTLPQPGSETVNKAWIMGELEAIKNILDPKKKKKNNKRGSMLPIRRSSQNIGR